MTSDEADPLFEAIDKLCVDLMELRWQLSRRIPGDDHYEVIEAEPAPLRLVR